MGHPGEFHREPDQGFSPWTYTHTLDRTFRTFRTTCSAGINLRLR